jgi:hypothetical protein
MFHYFIRIVRCPSRLTNKLAEIYDLESFSDVREIKRLRRYTPGELGGKRGVRSDAGVPHACVVGLPEKCGFGQIPHLYGNRVISSYKIQLALLAWKSG